MSLRGRSRVTWIVAACVLTSGWSALGASPPKWSGVEFSLKPQDASSASWTIRLNASGAGSYTESTGVNTTPRPLTISPATMARLGRGERAVRQGHCETKLKKIAQTGEKTILYLSPTGEERCTFNYSDDAGLMDAATAFQSIAQTLQAGERLQHEQRYDRLALDAEMDTLLAAVHDGSAIEVGNIAFVLRPLIADEHVIARVRREAARLLQDPDSVTAAAAGGAPSAR